MEKIPQQKHFDGLKIVLYGPESTGKSTLSRKLAQHYHTRYVEEYAREYLQQKYDASGEICAYEDLMPIVKGQLELENEAIEQASDKLFCDTDPLETYVYAMAYFNKAPQQLIKIIQESKYDLYLLQQVDVPWIEDDLRDKPHERKKMFSLFHKALEQFNKPYVLIDGLGDDRLKNAIKAIDTL